MVSIQNVNYVISNVKHVTVVATTVSYARVTGSGIHAFVRIKPMMIFLP
jgi:hypothetical protein